MLLLIKLRCGGIYSLSRRFGLAHEILTLFILVLNNVF